MIITHCIELPLMKALRLYSMVRHLGVLATVFINSAVRIYVCIYIRIYKKQDKNSMMSWSTNICMYMLTKTSLNFYLVFHTYVNPWNSSTLCIYMHIYIYIVN